ncbi:hypothetical protein AVEN_64658-1 [Araneus ventricosus]|uniref:Uncharacterized protein n=1 Tax=Araneus ventricosus TaxID=182803 RepID=A0A4Y2W6X2_ARAVE|nr:hypothetical protein AVEN_64658-1 [Araneus ventricosus]
MISYRVTLISKSAFCFQVQFRDPEAPQPPHLPQRGGTTQPASAGQCPRATADAEPQRRLLGTQANHPDPAFGQAQQDTDTQTGRQIHRLSLPGDPQRRSRRKRSAAAAVVQSLAVHILGA